MISFHDVKISKFALVMTVFFIIIRIFSVPFVVCRFNFSVLLS